MSDYLIQPNRFSRWLVIGVLLTLQACSTLPETISDQDTPEGLSAVTVPDRWKSMAEEGTHQLQMQWHQVIHSEQLDALIEEALKHNQDLQASASRVLAARSQAEIASGELLPEIDATLDGGRQRNAIGDTSNSFSASLNLRWELDVWGRLSNAEQAALLSYQEQQQLFYDARRSLAGQVAIAWIDAIEAKRQYQLSSAQENSLKESLDVIEDGFQRGIRPALDVYSARAEWLNGQTDTQERQLNLNTALRDLSVLIGRYPSVENDVPEALPLSLTALPKGLSSELLERRADVQAAYSAVLSQQSNVLSAGANRLPRFTLTASVGATSDSLSDVVRGDELVWNALGGLTAPIFDAGRLEAEEQRQQFLLEAAIADYRQTALTAFSEVEQTLDADYWIAKQLVSAKASVDVSQQAEQQAFENYLAGLENLNTWLQAQRTAFSRSSQLMALEAGYFQNRIQLHQALGGEFSVFTEQPVETSSANVSSSSTSSPIKQEP